MNPIGGGSLKSRRNKKQRAEIGEKYSILSHVQYD